jgi:hypothetical protein
MNMELITFDQLFTVSVIPLFIAFGCRLFRLMGWVTAVLRRMRIMMMMITMTMKMMIRMKTLRMAMWRRRFG